MRIAPLAFVAALLLSGCAGYKLGPTNGLEAGSRSIRIETPTAILGVRGTTLAIRAGSV